MTYFHNIFVNFPCLNLQKTLKMKTHFCFLPPKSPLMSLFSFLSPRNQTLFSLSSHMPKEHYPYPNLCLNLCLNQNPKKSLPLNCHWNSPQKRRISVAGMKKKNKFSCQVFLFLNQAIKNMERTGKKLQVILGQETLNRSDHMLRNTSQGRCEWRSNFHKR